MSTSLRPNDFGTYSLVAEHCHTIRIDDVVRKTKRSLKELLLQAQLNAMNIELELTTSILSHGGIRFWFKCPLCKQRIGVLFQHPISKQIGCRHCLHIDYRKHRYKGMIEERCIPS